MRGGSGRRFGLLRRAVLALAGLAALAACGPTVQGVGTVPQAPAAQGGPQQGPSTVDLLGRPLDPNAVRVALLLPLSGDRAAFGRTMLNAAELALFEVGGSELQLLPRDTGGTPEGAAAAARAAMADGARLILGPVFSESVRPVAQVAASEGVNVIAFTTDSAVAGGNAYVMGFLPDAEAERIIRYALSQNKDEFSVFAPNTPYGQRIAAAVEATVQRYGGTLGYVQYFDPSAQNYLEAARALATNAPQVDAILIPAGGAQLPAAAQAVRYYGLRTEQLLGTGVWDDPRFAAEPALAGGWFAAPDRSQRQGFDQRYQARFGEPASVLASLAYDAVALAAALARQPGARFDTATLSDPSGFSGVNGIFRFGRDGLVQRTLAILEVTPEGFVVRDPAPGTFVAAGF